MYTYAAHARDLFWLVLLSHHHHIMTNAHAQHEHYRVVYFMLSGLHAVRFVYESYKDADILGFGLARVLKPLKRAPLLVYIVYVYICLCINVYMACNVCMRMCICVLCVCVNEYPTCLHAGARDRFARLGA